MLRRWTERAADRPGPRSPRFLAACTGALFALAVITNYLQGDETWIGLVAAAIALFISVACSVSLLRERHSSSS